MGWFLSKQADDRKVKCDQLRPLRNSEINEIIRFEDRLVLGSLSPLPALPGYSDPSGGAADSSSGLSGTSSSAGSSLEYTPTASSATSSPSQGAVPEETPVDDGVEQLSGQTPGKTVMGSVWDQPDSPDSEHGSFAETLTSSSGATSLEESLETVPTGPQLSLETDQQDHEAPPVDDGTGDAILSSLQNQNPGTLVDPQYIQNGYYSPTGTIPWFDDMSEPVVIRYDFRDQNGVTNELTEEQIAVVEQALQAWTEATEGRITWIRDTTADDSNVVNIGLGSLAAVGLTSSQGGTLGASGTALTVVDGAKTVMGTIWLDHSETWENQIGNGDVEGTVDLFTAAAHEAGHIIGLSDSRADPDGLMYSGYSGEKTTEDVVRAYKNALFFPMTEATEEGLTGLALHSLTTDANQLSQTEVLQLLDRASAASASNDAIIAIVDRNGTILGVRVEQGVLDQFAGDDAGLIFAIDGAVAKARTAAFFANDTAPLTSRLVQFISQSTITQREVEGNPSALEADPTKQGPGYVAPIGLGAHFPPGIFRTPPVDLFGIEHTNRDNRINAGPDGLLGTKDDIGRFNIAPGDIPLDDNPLAIPGSQKNIVAPLSYGAIKDPANADKYVSRGVATLPGGVPIFRDTDDNGTFDKLIGGIGVFFPGEDGYATHEQGFVPGVGQTSVERVNASRALEAEYIAFAALGGSPGAVRAGANGAVIGDIAGIPPVDDIGLPFGNLTLVGIALPVFGDIAGVQGVRNLLRFARENLTEGTPSGANETIPGGSDGYEVPSGHLVTPKDSAIANGLTKEDVTQIIEAAVDAANVTRAAIRLQENGQPGATARMVIAITDTNGEVLGLYRMEDATVFSIDVAVAKARNVSYYADASALQPQDQVPGIDPGTAFSNRTFRFLAEPRFPDGVDGSQPPVFSILRDAAAANIDPMTGENLGLPADKAVFQSVYGYDSFNPGTNFRDPDNKENQNGIIFFPGSTPLYKDGVLVGGLGVSGDGVDQDDIVTFLAAQGFLPTGVTTKADETFVDGVRLPFQKFNRTPFAIGPLAVTDPYQPPA